jgi:hypothetical protein
MSDSTLATSATGTPVNQPPSNGSDGPFDFEYVKKKEREALGAGNGQPSALCISGGGIRSATFALGALQGLADLEILEHFDYLSTVSGGGYIGGWLTAWKQRAKGLKNIIPALESTAPPVAPGKLDPIQHLREYNNYLSPKLGFFSADTWTLVATVGRNMLLNWLVFIPLLMFALTIPRIVLSLARLGETYSFWYVSSVGTCFKWVEDHYVLPILGVIFFATTVFNALRYLPGVGHKNHTEGQFLKNCFLPFFLAVLAVVTTDAWFTGGDFEKSETTMTFSWLLFWIMISGVLGYAAYIVLCWREVKKKFQELKAAKLVRKWPRLKFVSAFVVAGVLTSLSTAGGAWLLVATSFRYLHWPVYVTFAMPLLFVSFGLAVTVFVGFTSRVLNDDDREWLARAGAWGLLFVACWIGFAALTLLLPQLLFDLHGKLALWVDSAIAAAGGIGGLLATLAGLSSKNKAKPQSSGTSQQESSGLVDLAAKLAAPLFIAVFLGCLAILTNVILWKTGVVLAYWKEHRKLLEETRPEIAVILAVLFVSFSWIMARVVDINKFSLQAMYRNRLIRAYLGASNENPDLNEFTGFAGNDNPLLSNLTPTMRPFHVVNMALNLVSGKRLAWQQRKAESFTATALHCGYGNCYRPANGYGGPGGLSLGTAVAISGAAASPNMGYHSSPAMTFIMTLFNARLGSWLGNPHRHQWTHEGPKSAFDSIVREAFGLTDDTSPYVYLSDGGHFENLAIYEMVRRRCKYIVVLDGGADPDYTYEDIGNALRKIRIDMNVSIEFEPPFLEQLKQASSSSSESAPAQNTNGSGPEIAGLPKNRCAVAKIRYSNLDEGLEDGHLIYIKPVVLSNEPPDVIAYKIANDDFPHQSTGDQWFDESQTESYRTLGLWSITDVFHPWAADGFSALVKDADNYRTYQPEKRAVEAATRRSKVAAEAAARRAAAKPAAARAGAGGGSST